jgi:hypothetical protein
VIYIVFEAAHRHALGALDPGGVPGLCAGREYERDQCLSL